MTREQVVAIDWQLFETGPREAERTVLLLPGGMCSARSWLEVTQQPALSGLRLVAATLPGQAGAPPLADSSLEAYGRVTAELVDRLGADVVVGFSMGANVALEMLERKLFAGPTVLLGVSLSAPDESALFLGAVRASRLLGGVPLGLLKRGAGAMVRSVPVSKERRAELVADFRRTRAPDVLPGLHAYLAWLQSGEDHAAMLCRTGVPTWVVHAEKGGDGGLTDAERQTLEACPSVRVVTVPGKVFFLPNEVPDRVAAIIGEAVAAVGP